MLAPGGAWVEARRTAGEPGPGEVVVGVRAVGLNYHDFANSLGLIDGPWPRVPLTDGAGVVEAVGPGVTAWRVGDRVLSTFYPRWQEGPIRAAATGEVPGDTCDGWLQERRRCRADSLVAAPAHLDDAGAAALPCAGTTAWSALQAAGIAAGSTVVTMGTGGVATLALQLAKARGARVIALSSTPGRLELLRRLGADDVISYRHHPDWHTEVHALTDGRGADLVVDVAGADTLPRSVRAVGYGGTVAVIGVLGGMDDAALPVTHVMLRNIRVAGVTVGSVADHAALVAEVERHGIRPHVSAVHDWTRAAEVVAGLADGTHTGKIALTVG